MLLSLITNDPIIANYAETAGINRIMIDLEVKGKNIRQSGKNLFLSDHSIGDLPVIKAFFKEKSLFVRINPIHQQSKEEIDAVIRMGADIVMLPFFRSMDEVVTFLELTNGAVKNSLLVETKEAAELLPKLVDLKDVHEIHIGFNDLSISFGYRTIFEPIRNGSLDEYAKIVNYRKIPWGFGGLAKLSDSALPIDPQLILFEQLRLNASIGWLGRSFRDSLDRDRIGSSLREEVLLIRTFLRDHALAPKELFDLKHAKLLEQIDRMISKAQSI